ENVKSENVKSKKTKPKKEPSFKMFWGRSKQGNLIISNTEFLSFVEGLGFGRYYAGETKDWVLVNKTDNVIREVDIPEVKKSVKDILIGEEFNEVADELLYTARWFSKGNLDAVERIELNPLRDTAKSCYVPFKNGIVHVTANETKIIPYKESVSQIWDTHIVNRDIRLDKEYMGNDYIDFLRKISGSDQKFNALKTMIGYLIHTYKFRSTTKVPILLDEATGSLEGRAEGGTGKSLVFEPLQYIRRTVFINGNRMDTRKSFVMQEVNIDHQVVIVDDLEPNYNMQGLFSSITGTMTIEKKNKQPIQIPYEFSPKIAINSNYLPNGEGASFERRKYEFEVKKIYSDTYQPIDDYGREFFSYEWTEKDWNQVFNFWIDCAKCYLKYKLIKPENENISFKKLVGATSLDFARFLESETWVESRVDSGEWSNSRELYVDFMSEFEVTAYDCSPKKWHSNLRKLAEHTSKRVEFKGQGCDKEFRYA
ncbi:hypothetical protein KA005_77730, partial [bacterium]|nr:hypothetical protein [bacterium]